MRLLRSAALRRMRRTPHLYCVVWAKGRVAGLTAVQGDAAVIGPIEELDRLAGRVNMHEGKAAVGHLAESGIWPAKRFG